MLELLCGKTNDTRMGSYRGQGVNPEKPDVPLNKNDAFQKVQKRRVQEKVKYTNECPFRTVSTSR